MRCVPLLVKINSNLVEIGFNSIKNSNQTTSYDSLRRSKTFTWYRSLLGEINKELFFFFLTTIAC